MSVRSLILFTIACATIISVVHSNPGRQIACWPLPLKYQNFNVNFYFWSRNHQDQQILANSTFGPDDIDFDPKRRTVVIAHGYLANSHLDLRIINRLIEWQDLNVIAASWEAGSSSGQPYHQAVINSEFAAISIKNFFFRLIDYSLSNNIPLKNWGPLHFMGHSLGAHVVGQAAELVKQQHNLVVDRVTGLDPAEPCFEDADMPLRLNKTNARFVDVIHTDAALKRNHATGLRDPIGHIDFYVNGGSIQPGCKKYRKKRFLNYRALLAHSSSNRNCYHLRAVLVFEESLIQEAKKECKFWAYPWSLDSSPEDTETILQNKCDANTCVEMGINAESYEGSHKSIYYVPTTDAKPYCNI